MEERVMTQQDYSLMLQIINAASKAGLFAAQDLSTVGQLVNNIKAAAEAAAKEAK